MIKSGKSNQQILGVHPEVRRNLGAIKAHVTMGSYD